MKLSSLLFESIDENTILQELIKARKDLSTKEYYTSIWRETSPEDFFYVNKNLLIRLLKDADEFRFLASGSDGSAFSIGDKVLKLNSYPAKPDQISDYLYGGEKKRGKFFPMIYAQGRTYTKGVYYVILEMFETIPPIWQELLDDILSVFEQDGWRKAPTEETIKYVIEKDAAAIKEMEANLRLAPNWLPRLYNDIKTMVNMKDYQADLHAGNVGIRRSGGEGYLVFFD